MHELTCTNNIMNGSPESANVNLALPDPFSFLAPTTAQIAQRNAYFQASEHTPDNVCPFQRVSGIGRALIPSTCRSFVIPKRDWGQASSLTPFCSFTQSAFICLHRNIPFAGDPDFWLSDSITMISYTKPSKVIKDEFRVFKLDISTYWRSTAN